MSLTKAAKTEQVNAVHDFFSRSTAAVFVDFKGLDVAKVTELRAEFRKVGVDYRVVKNRLVKLALKGTKFEKNKELEGYLKGPTAIAWSYEDPSAAAKVLKSFRQDPEISEKINIKCGVFEKTILSGNRVESELATMPNKDEARAMLLAQLQAPAQTLLRQLNAAGQKCVLLLEARKRQLEENQ
ncbi:MAG: 50S ribosomal protein L10 [Deltaproteobacteria bacterium]|nr:50S ribosomal protein L10 [Deltaproteobacteria bacterium]